MIASTPTFLYWEARGRDETARVASRMIRRYLIRMFAAALVLLSAGGAVLRTRAVLWPWMTQSVKLYIGTLAYNAFALVVVQPLLKKWFPPLKPWEHVTGLFGQSRTTYEEIVPVVATTLWIVGNALFFALMNRNLRQTQAAIAAGGAATTLDSRLRTSR